LILCAAAAGEAQAVKFTRQELNVPGGILWMSTGDLDGDQKTDLVLSYRRGSGPRSQRFMAVFFRGEKGYAQQPDVAIAAPKNAGIFDVGDAFGDAKDELIYLAPDGVYAQTFVDRKPSNPTRVLTTPSLISSPEEDDLVVWDFLRTPARGEAPIMVVPGRSDLRIFKREGETWKPWSKVDIDQYSSYDAEIYTFRRDRRGGSSGRPYAFRATTVVPLLDFIDQTGDGEMDLVTSYEDRVAVHPMLEDGTISARALQQMWFSVRSPNELETRDAGVSTTIVDLDRDGIADACVQKIAGGITTLATETHLYRGIKGGGFESKPAQSFKDEGFASLAGFVDVDGDGILEMLHPISSVSIVAISQMMLSKELSLGIRIRRASSEKPLFFEKKEVQKLDTLFGLDLTVGATLRGAAPIFGYDFDGDGLKDVITSQGGDKMVLHRGIRKGNDIFQEEGHVTLSAPGTSTTIPIHPDVAKAGRPDLLLYYVDRADLAGKMYLFTVERD
jgi:hypothetical protein